MRKITVGSAIISDRAKALVNQALDSNRISSGKFVSEFEKLFAKYHGVRNAISVSTGSDADTLALVACGGYPTKRESEIIIPALTFVSCANSVLHAGFIPRFVDIDPLTYQIDPSEIEKALSSDSSKVKGIMPVHLFGRPANMDPIKEIAKKYNLFIVEDAAEAHGAEYKGAKVGTIGDAGAFSFYVAHIITTGEGGAVITNNNEYAGILRSLRAHGRACKCEKCVLNIDSSYCPLRFEYGEGIDTRFFFERIGYSSKMNELEAALGIADIEKLDEIINKRRSNLFYLNKELSKYKDFFQFFEEMPNERISPLVYPLVIRPEASFTRKDITDFLERKGIETRPMFGSIPTQQPAYKFIGHREGDFKNSEFIGKNGFYIGTHQGLNQEDLDYILTVFEDFIKKH
ncbi:MAG: DegT/DnrJ/EryC1/StrS family aminotransferase [Candidatus Schekmanbacteria bacterium]|nr:DegT/DnrJ/EryC1/StrS family aminotransferase [Candidatus Schekmanbacteria bacterium]